MNDFRIIACAIGLSLGVAAAPTSFAQTRNPADPSSPGALVLPQDREHKATGKQRSDEQKMRDRNDRESMGNPRGTGDATRANPQRACDPQLRVQTFLFAWCELGGIGACCLAANARRCIQPSNSVFPTRMART